MRRYSGRIRADSGFDAGGACGNAAPVMPVGRRIGLCLAGRRICGTGGGPGCRLCRAGLVPAEDVCGGRSRERWACADRKLEKRQRLAVREVFPKLVAGDVCWACRASGISEAGIAEVCRCGPGRFLRRVTGRVGGVVGKASWEVPASRRSTGFASCAWVGRGSWWSALYRQVPGRRFVLSEEEESWTLGRDTLNRP